jgi:ribosomal protein S18 acetylase RimI-like enzyme
MDPPSACDATVASRIALRQAATPQQVATVRELFREYAQAIGTDLEFQGFSGELAALPKPYVPPKGALLLAQAGGAVAGCVGLRPLEGGLGEMKRLYVRPAYRKFGLGRRLVQAVVDAARAAGHRELRLDTLASMGPAQALYRQLGFVEIAPYNPLHMPGTRFYSLDLSS